MTDTTWDWIGQTGWSSECLLVVAWRVRFTIWHDVFEMAFVQSKSLILDVI